MSNRAVAKSFDNGALHVLPCDAPICRAPSTRCNARTTCIAPTVPPALQGPYDEQQVTCPKRYPCGIIESRKTPIQRALALYQQGVGSLGYVAELVGLPKRVLMEKARQRGSIGGMGAPGWMAFLAQTPAEILDLFL